MESIEVLKKMIKSWLDDTHPGMPDTQRQSLADAMDVTLVEEMKEEYMKSLGLNTLEVVRMSFIEMQWLKKVRWTVLYPWLWVRDSRLCFVTGNDECSSCNG